MTIEEETAYRDAASEVLNGYAIREIPFTEDAERRLAKETRRILGRANISIERLRHVTDEVLARRRKALGLKGSPPRQGV